MRRYVRRDPIERFWENVTRGQSDECWIWRGFEYGQGYGGFYAGPDAKPTVAYAHRFSFEMLRRSLEHGEVVHHLCGAKKCVNPDHLEALPSQSSHARKHDLPKLWSEANRKAVYCKRGHEWTIENTGYQAGGTKRYCKACHNARGAAWRAQNPERYREIRRMSEARRAA